MSLKTQYKKKKALGIALCEATRPGRSLLEPTVLPKSRKKNNNNQNTQRVPLSYRQVSLVVVGEVDEEIFGGHQLHDGIPQELHPLVVAPGTRDGRRHMASMSNSHKQPNATNRVALWGNWDYSEKTSSDFGFKSQWNRGAGAKRKKTKSMKPAGAREETLCFFTIPEKEDVWQCASQAGRMDVQLAAVLTPPFHPPLNTMMQM